MQWEGVAQSTRLQVRLEAELLGRVHFYARERALGLSPAVRQLLVRGLTADGTQQQTAGAAVAGLLAAEQTLKLLETIVPDGSARSARAGELAVAAAERRIDAVRGEP